MNVKTKILLGMLFIGGAAHYSMHAAMVGSETRSSFSRLWPTIRSYFSRVTPSSYSLPSSSLKLQTPSRPLSQNFLQRGSGAFHSVGSMGRMGSSLMRTSMLPNATNFPAYRLMSSQSHDQQKRASREQKLLQRLIVAKGQGDEQTVHQTMQFIEKIMPDLIPRAREELEKMPAKEFTKGPVVEYASKPAHDIFSFWNLEPDPEFDAAWEKIFPKGWYEEFLEFEKIVKAHPTIPAINKEIESAITKDFEDRVKKVRITVNIQDQLPNKTWWEFIMRDHEGYEERVFNHVFSPKCMKIVIEPLGLQDRQHFFDLWKKNIDHLGLSAEQVRIVLRRAIRMWMPNAAFRENSPHRGDNPYAYGCYLLRDSITEAIKNEPILLKFLLDNNIIFYDFFRYDYEAQRIVGSHVSTLRQQYKDQLCEWIDEFIKKPEYVGRE